MRGAAQSLWVRRPGDPIGARRQEGEERCCEDLREPQALKPQADLVFGHYGITSSITEWTAAGNMTPMRSSPLLESANSLSQRLIDWSNVVQFRGGSR
jgi:hypothetical protein